MYFPHASLPAAISNKDIFSLDVQIPDWHWGKRANPVSGLVLEKSVVKAVVGIHHLLQWTISSEGKVAEKSTTNPFNAQQTT
ncbi:hypothetical protein HYF36_004478 [Salmonella enterica]|nr:hypothetical protein [Salmonella enterica]ELP5468393.1 hypothetical protein [Salmonella enterica]